MFDHLSQPITNRRQCDWVQLRSYLFCNSLPATSISIKAHELDYVGSLRQLNINSLHLTAAYGSKSTKTAAQLATSWANRNHTYAHPIDIWVKVPGLTASRKQMTQASIEQSHWLHIDRIAAPLQKEIKAQLLAWVYLGHGVAVASAATVLTVPQLLLVYPDLASRLLDEFQYLGMIVHPVKTKFDTDSEVQKVIWVATVRTDRLAVAAAELRFANAECVM